MYFNSREKLTCYKHPDTFHFAPDQFPLNITVEGILTAVPQDSGH